MSILKRFEIEATKGYISLTYHFMGLVNMSSGVL